MTYIFTGDDMKRPVSAPMTVSVLFLLILLFMPEICSLGISEGLKSCCNILIPSLFPYMVLSGFMMRSGAAQTAGRLISPVTKGLFYLPGSCAAVMLLSFIGGYPVSAKCVSLLYQSGGINREQAERMMCFCVCPGPAFLITGVGVLMLGSPDSGGILYASQLISCLIIGILLGVISRLNGKKPPEKENHHIRADNGIIGEFILSCRDGAASMLDMTALVIIFVMLLGAFENIGASQLAGMISAQLLPDERAGKIIVPVLFEVTSGCRSVFNSGLPLWYMSFAAGFGGLCVHFQIFAILGSVPLRKSLYLFWRFLNSVLSTFITYVLCIFIPADTAVFAVSGGGNAELSASTAVGSTALLMLCGLFALSLRKSWFSFGR